MNKTCIACGMPMESAEDFPKGDVTRDYCCYCAKPNGEMQSYEEKVEGYSNWLVDTQGITKTAALAQTKTILAQLPAWMHIKV
jgi:hypothetical protein